MKGNNPDRWNALLDSLDEKLQLGLLEYLRRVNVYHFEGNTLYLVPGSQEDRNYFSKPAVTQQLTLLAHDAVKVEKIELKSEEI